MKIWIDSNSEAALKRQRLRQLSQVPEQQHLGKGEAELETGERIETGRQSNRL